MTILESRPYKDHVEMRKMAIIEVDRLASPNAKCAKK
jgi:hypothetical protein